MKKTIAICVLIVCLAAFYGYAQMGGGMMGGGMGEERDEYMPGQNMTGMAQMMSQMARMMHQVSSIMRNDLSPREMREMSEITADMSAQMRDMSRLMGTDYFDPGEMQDLQWRMRETEDRLRGMR